MAKTITASLILILLIVATLNNYSVEGAAKEKDGGVDISQKLGPVTDCYFLYLKCVVFRIFFFCPAYSAFCLHHETTAATPTTTPKAENLP
jgi:hypothetical protein